MIAYVLELSIGLKAKAHKDLKPPRRQRPKADPDPSTPIEHTLHSLPAFGLTHPSNGGHFCPHSAYRSERPEQRAGGGLEGTGKPGTRAGDHTEFRSIARIGSGEPQTASLQSISYAEECNGR